MAGPKEIQCHADIDFSTIQVKSNLLIPRHVSKYLVFVRFDDVFQCVNSGGEADEFLAGINVSDHAIYNIEFSSSYILPQTFQAEFEIGIFCPVVVLVAKVDPSLQIAIKSFLIPRRLNESRFK